MKPRPLSEKPTISRPFSAIKHKSEVKYTTPNPQTSTISQEISNIKEKPLITKESAKENPANKLLTEKNTMQCVEFPLNYRIAHPAKSNYLVSLDFWKENNQNNKSLKNWYKRPETAKEKSLLRGFSLPRDPAIPFEQFQELELDAKNLNSNTILQKLNYENEKPFAFLSSIGGKQTSYTQIINAKTENIQFSQSSEENIEEVAKQIQMFSKIDMDKSLKSQIKRQNSANKTKSRPLTVNSANNLAFPNTFRINSAVFQEKRLQTGLPQVKKPIQETKQRPMTALIEKNPKFSAKTQGMPPVISARNSRNQPVSAKSRNFSARNQLQNQIFEKNLDLFDEVELDIREDFEENDEFYEKAEQFQAHSFKNRPKSNLLTSRPISGRSAAPEQFFNIFTKYAKFNDVELPYEDLFDRNERTIAATYAKFGDLGYYSPVQRIGAYMQFGAKLKREHLVEIINLQKTITNIEKSEYEIPIQLAIIDDLNPFQNKIKTGISTTFQPEDVNRTPITLTLYPEYIEDESDEMLSSAITAQKLFQRMLVEMRGNYDPELLGRSNYVFINPETWPENIKQKVISSMARYRHYLNSELIRPEDISKYRKDWMTNAFSLVPEPLLRYEECARKVFQEIFENYRIAMKQTIMDYILRSPEERKRLHIELLPRKTFCSAERIAREGGFSLMLYPDWHSYVVKGRASLENKMVLMNVINSSLLNWFDDFKEFLLMETETMKEFGVLGHTLNIPAFMKQENIYRSKSISVLKNIWFRGCILIIRKFKFLRKNSQKPGKWTFNGFKDYDSLKKTSNSRKNLDNSLNTSSMSQNSKMNDSELEEKQKEKVEKIYQNILQSKLDQECNFEQPFDFYSHVSMNDLKDIRDNSAFKIYLLSIDKQLKLSEDGWKSLPKEARKLILESAGYLMSLEMRNLIEKSIEKFEKFILSIPSYASFRESLGFTTKMVSNLEVIPQHNDEEKESPTIISKQKENKLIRTSIDSNMQSIAVPTVQDKDTIQSQHFGFEDFSHSKINASVEQNSLLKMQDSMNEEQPSDRTPQNMSQERKVKRRPSNIMQKLQRLDSRTEEKSILTLVKPDKELEFNEIEFLNHQNLMFPFLRIDMNLGEEGLFFDEKEEYIKQEFIGFIKNILNSFEGFSHPRAADVEATNDDKSQGQENRRHAFQAENNFMTLDHDTIYSRFCSFLKLKDKTQKKKKNSIFEVSQNPTAEKEKTEQQTLKVANFNEKMFLNSCNKIVNHVVTLYKECYAGFQVFQQFKPFIDRHIIREIDQFLNKKTIKLEEYKAYVLAFNKFENLWHKLPNNIYFTLFDVSCYKVKEGILKMIEEQRFRILNHLEAGIILNMRKLCDKYSSIVSYIRKSTIKAEEVEAMEKYLYDLTADRIIMKQNTNENFQRFVYLLKLDHVCSENVLNLTKELFEWPQNLDKELKSNEEKHHIERIRLEESLREQRKKFDLGIEIHTEDIKNVENYTEYSKYKNYIQDLERLEDILNDLNNQMLEISDQERKLFGYNSNYDKFIALQNLIQPHCDLWKSLGSFLDKKKSWMGSPVNCLDPGDIENNLKQNKRITQKLSNSFDSNSITIRILNEFKEDIENMGKNLPSIEILSNKGLRERHWEIINNSLNISFNYKEGSLKEILLKGVQDFLPEIGEISETASKEYKLEMMLDKMEKEWQNLKFGLIKWKNRGISIFQGTSIEDIQMLLDDHTIKAQTIRSNPNIKFMEERAIKWERLMLYVQDVLEVWIEVQAKYLYLEPIFNFEDINKNLAIEAEKFGKVNMAWIEIMRYVENDPLVLNIEQIPNLLDTLKNCMKLIEEIEKGLEQHLEEKRLEFPRFFFLSNEDLINILAETRDPLLVQPHLKKCFEGIYELIFNSYSDILGMRSFEKEEINFIEKISPKDYKSNVEKWLLRVEEEMRNGLQKVMEDSLIDLNANKISQTDWIRKWPGQIVLCNTQTKWTAKVEESLQKTKGLDHYYEELTLSLEEIVKLVRGNLTSLELLTLGALIVIEVHNRDIVKYLINENVKNAMEFEWIAQLRYYWEPKTCKNLVKMITTTIDYGYEYLGNSERLVITPLTDRCYRTLMSALNLNLGGAPEGPAGTGKTETTKDLAKALAMQCIVFNCSEGINIHSMAKFFKGLIASGAWSCFDEFNRIFIEVLSVIAQQILQIQQAKAMGKEKFVFEGTDLRLKTNCNIFITMNPGYAGRTELPDNLKALFRPVAMMVPDYAMISEIKLYSYGFIDARILARKIVATYRLCSELLSTQSHYDYGMRAVKTVLTSASQLKRKYQFEKEEVLILRALNDVNLPKFLTQDILLFNGIINDLFPNVKPQIPEYLILNNAITQAFNNSNLQNVMSLRKKIIQLYEMINCRHGIMLVGQTLSGKTTCYKILSAALKECVALGDPEEKPASYHIINPKALNLSQLYGYSDPVSKEWTEGVLADIFRKCATTLSNDRQFIVFDGPVDADWIENMNSVLDDNKKLCLMNGETIQMSNLMTMMFEVSDLLQASPATVSRCGMVYLQPDQIGWWPIFQTKLQELSNNFDSQIIKHIEELFDAMVRKCLDFVKSKCVEFQTIPEGSCVITLMKLLKVLLISNGFLNKELFNKLRFEDIMPRIDMMFLFALMWSVGGSIDEQGRQMFNKFYRKLIQDSIKCDTKKDRIIKFDKISIPPEIGGGIIYDFYLEDFKWRSWKDLLDKTELNIPLNKQYHEILIPTAESLRITYLLQIAIDNEIPFLLIGPTGTGKSLYVNTHLKQLNSNHYLIVPMSFSAKTTANKTFDIINYKLEKRRKNVYGPTFGMKCLIFIDDLNMPTYDKYGAQPPIELLRQFIDHKGFYNKERKFIEIIDTQLITAMGPPGGGRSLLTSRFIRHFMTLGCSEPDEKGLKRIFTNLMGWFINKKSIEIDLHNVFNLAVDASIDLYLKVNSNLKAIPSKPHYLFNLRDLSRTIQGIQIINKKEASNPSKIVRLCIHEFCRVFYDRLSTEEDETVFFNILSNVVRVRMKEDIKMVMKDIYNPALGYDKPVILKEIRFSDAMGEEVIANDRPYDEVLNTKKLEMVLDSFLDDYNTNSKKPMNLVLFEFAIDHILRILRILKMAQGHAVLIGLGGTGRQSLTKLVSFIRDYEMFQIELSKYYNWDQWKQDLIKIMSRAGADCKDVVLMLSESHLKFSFILEDINNILNTADVPNLFQEEDFMPLLDKVRTNAKRNGLVELSETGTSSQAYDFFIETVKKHLHIVLIMSPVGDSLRNRIRNFPSIVNCTNIIMFKQWPTEALEHVAENFFQDLFLNSDLQKNLVKSCKFFHETIMKTSKQFFENEGRFNYVTPSSYLELIKLYKNLIGKQKNKIENFIQNYKTGVQKLLITAEKVKILEVQLKEKKPILIQMNEETSKLAEEIKAQALAMEPTKQKVEKEEALVNERVKEAELINEECEKDLSKAKPKLKQAEDALDTLDANDINLLKSMLKPPETVRLVFEALCVLYKLGPIPAPFAKNPKDKIPSYWETSKKLLNDKDFLKNMISFEKDKIDEEAMKKIRERYISRTADFNPKRVEKASGAAKGICEWILALSEYEKVLKIVRPKMERYRESKKEVAQLQQSLYQTQAELSRLNKEILALQENYFEIHKKQVDLENEIKDCEKRILLANALINSLSGEKQRWSDLTNKLEDSVKYLHGDILISSGIISYLGCFSSNYRMQIIKEWNDFIKNNKILVSDSFSLENCLGEAIQVKKWVMNGLPSDPFSRENGMIISESSRWPLMIDPQNQANKWIKNNESENKLIVVKLTDSDFIRNLENSIQFGFSLLIENASEELDSILDPLLSKQFFKNQGILSIKIGENIIEYSKTFKLFITSKLRNPNYIPEISTKITLVNFMITREGLEDQLLEVAVSKEKPELEEQRTKLIIQDHENKKKLLDIEKQILDVLNKEGNILDDENALEILTKSKLLSNEIEEKQKAAEITEVKIEEARIGYKPIAIHSTVLFFSVISMGQIEVMYQYSLSWFIQLFLESFDKSERSSFLKQRIDNVIDAITYSIYCNVSRSIYEKDKLLFSFILLIQLLKNKKYLDSAEYDFFISPLSSIPEKDITANPVSGFLPQETWIKIHKLTKILKKFQSLPESLTAREQEWKEILDSSEIYKAKFPEPFKDCSYMQRLCLLKILRPDKVILAVREFIAKEMSDKYVTPITFDINLSFNDSSPTTPLVFLLPGTDPLNILTNLAESKSKALKTISLGQGQGIHAEKAIEDARKLGNWVLLQNCHLAPSWMSSLEKICEDIESKLGREKLHPSFRLWLTTFPSNDFPIGILQNSIKMTNEPPKGLKSNVKVSFMNEQISDRNFFENHPKPKSFKSLLFGLCFFHAIIQERRTYGPLGWNIYYEFNQNDLKISAKQVHLFTANYEEIPFKALDYLIGECNYGGRITDERDRRLIHALMKEYFSEKIFNKDFLFCDLSDYPLPNASNTYEQFLQNIDKLPLMPNPQLFGFHPNAQITKDINETNDLYSSLLLAFGGKTDKFRDENSESQLSTILNEILEKIPKKFDLEIAVVKYPISGKNSLNSVLLQELVRFNTLLKTIVDSLKEIDQALKGLIGLSESMDKVCNYLLKGLVPELWRSKSYPSLRHLASYIDDFIKRLKFFQKWIDVGPPSVYWVSGFFFTQSFLTGILQNFARKYTIAIDLLGFEYDFMGEPGDPNDHKRKYKDPNDGNYIYGLFLEGAKWDYDKKKLEEAENKKLFVEAPIILLKPQEVSKIDEKKHYKCPVYRTVERKGVLSTTGHSTNFIMNIEMWTDREEDHWIKRGTAMICELKD